MKKIAFLLCMLTTPGFCVQKCVYFDPTVNGSSDYSTCPNCDWGVKFYNFFVGGVSGACTSNGGNQGDIADDLVFDTDNQDNNRFCWCKSVIPAVSKWVLVYEEYSEQDCSYSCQTICNYFVSDNVTVREAMFSTWLK